MRVYTVSFQNIVVAVGMTDLFTITATANKPVRLLSLDLANVGGVADVGDAEEEMLRISIIRGFTTVVGGVSATPVPMDIWSPPAGFTATRVTTSAGLATGGVQVILYALGWNVRVPLERHFPCYGDADARPSCVVDGAEVVTVVRSLANLADSMVMSGTLTVAEG